MNPCIDLMTKSIYCLKCDLNSSRINRVVIKVLSSFIIYKKKIY